MASVDAGQVRVPVEHRFFGMDRRTFPHALFVVAVFLIATVIIPRIDDAVAWDDPIQAGDQVAIAGDVTFTPTTGWNLEEGERVGGTVGQSGQVVLVHDSVTLSIVADSFDGTPAELVTQIAKVTSSTGDPTFRVSGDQSTIPTADGQVGVTQAYSSVQGDGVVAAFVIDGTGVEVTAYGPPAQMAAAADDLHGMITSIGTSQTDGSAS
ncbi:hypothetical protein [Cellulomonas sp. Leaf334]|uniref:hypothetical protein n=1 Tax=Cellulomonas sp. Leaf334 TaxID=1736339 RepID=UPI0006FBAD69|nr:hypothetical protein [Cellulomonas sp. Leaf334]KQR17251.1 hypothetical protein ASF78_08125 [Cellulomonas sp. Leaf334]